MDGMPVLVQLSAVIVIGYLAYIAITAAAKRLDADSLVWWPIVLYVPGPLAAYLLFSGQDFFAGYVSPESVFVSSLVLVGGFFLYRIFLGKRLARQVRFDIAQIRKSPVINGAAWPFVLLGLLCAVAQLLLIRDTGASLLEGSYILGDDKFAENRTLFTMTAGLYEIFAAILAFRIVGTKLTLRRDGLFLLFAFAVIAMRMFGGTRLIVLELVLFIVMVRVLEGRISKKVAALSAAGFAAILMLVGSLRGSEAADGSNILFLLFAEPALGNLSATFVTGYYLDHGVPFNPNAILDSLGYIVFVIIHLLPNAIYQALGGDIILLGDWGYYRSWAEPFFPFRDILANTGLDTVSPVGGQSVIALGVALFGYAGAVLIVPLTYGVFSWLRSMLPRSMPLILILGFEAPSVFREGAELVAKQVFIVAVVFWLFSKLCAIPIGTIPRSRHRPSPVNTVET
jgi:hypothetical protein